MRSTLANTTPREVTEVTCERNWPRAWRRCRVRVTAGVCTCDARTMGGIVRRDEKLGVEKPQRRPGHPENVVRLGGSGRAVLAR